MHRTSIVEKEYYLLTAIMSPISLCNEHLDSYTNKLRRLVRLPVLYRSEGRGFWVGCEANITKKKKI
jgi:hypothetical protein